MWVELQIIIYEFDLFGHYIHSLQIMKIKKYFFITLVCIDLFLGGGVGLSTTTSFFFYYKHWLHIICMPNTCVSKSISAYKLHAK